MKVEDIPQNGWIYGIKKGLSSEVTGIINTSSDITEVKSRIITEMTELMTECAQVIQHANAMKDDKICTCKEKGSGK